MKKGMSTWAKHGCNSEHKISCKIGQIKSGCKSRFEMGCKKHKQYLMQTWT